MQITRNIDKILQLLTSTMFGLSQKSALGQDLMELLKGFRKRMNTTLNPPMMPRGIVCSPMEMMEMMQAKQSMKRQLYQLNNAIFMCNTAKITIAAIGLSANFMLAVILIRGLARQKLSKKRYYFVLSLAVSDLIASALILITSSLLQLEAIHNNKTYKADIWAGFEQVAQYTPAVNYVTICFLQNLAVQKPFFYVCKITQAFCFGVITIDWLVMGAIAAGLLYTNSYLMDSLKTLNQIKLQNVETVFLFSKLSFLCVFMVIVILTYITIRYKISRRGIPNHSTRHSSTSSTTGYYHMPLSSRESTCNTSEFQRKSIKFVKALSLRIQLYVFTAGLLVISQSVHWYLSQSSYVHALIGKESDSPCKSLERIYIVSTNTKRAVLTVTIATPIWLCRLVLDPIFNIFGDKILRQQARFFGCSLDMRNGGPHNPSSGTMSHNGAVILPSSPLSNGSGADKSSNESSTRMQNGKSLSVGYGNKNKLNGRSRYFQNMSDGIFGPKNQPIKRKQSTPLPATTAGKESDNRVPRDSSYDLRLLKSPTEIEKSLSMSESRY